MSENSSISSQAGPRNLGALGSGFRILCRVLGVGSIWSVCALEEEQIPKQTEPQFSPIPPLSR